MYKIKQLIDEGLNMETLSNETKSGIALLETITQGYSVEDEVGHNLDEELYKDVAINYQGAMSEKTKDRLAGKAVEAISEEKIPEPAKVAGNPFIGDAYFKNNPDKVLGEQSLGGRFGSSIMVSGDRDVVDVIDVPQVPKVFTKFSEDISSSDVPKEKIIDKVFENYEKEKAEPKQKPHLKKSISKQKREMISTEQVYNPEFYTVREVAEKENKEISREEMEAFLYADPSIPYKNYIDEFQFAKDDLIKNGFLFYHDGKFVYKWVYLSGDMNVKMTMLKRDEDIIKEQFGEATYEAQKKAILSVMPRQMDISRNDADADSISIIPHSEFAKSFMVQGEEAVFILKEYRFKAKENFNLFDLFLLYLGYLTQRERSAFLNADPDHVVKFVLRKTIKERNEPKAKDPAEAKLAKKRREEAKQKAKEIAEMLFRKMLYEELTSECKMRFKIIWNERYNTTNLPDYKKIPVAFSMSKFIGDQVLTLNTTQRESVAFVNYIKSGCLALEVGLGKGHLLTSPILTPNGYVKMGDLKVNDLVIRKNGHPTAVTGIFPLGKVQCYKVTFSDGSYTEVSDEHLWNVQTINYRGKYPHKWDTVRTKDIINDLYNYRGDYQYSIPMVEPVQFNEQTLPIHPYLLGALLGDGGLSQDVVYFTNPEIDILNKIKSLLPESVSLIDARHDGLNFRISRNADSGHNEVTSILRTLGLTGTLSNTKFIPDIYKVNSPENRLELLRGLLDTDAWIQPSKHGKKGCTLVYTTVSKWLRDDVIFLVQSFGGTCLVSEKLPHFTHNGEKKTGQLAYNISIRMPAGIIPISSQKMLDKYIEKTKYQPIRFIQSIEDIGMQEAQCIKVAAEDELYVCDNFIVTHNTIAALACISQALANNYAKKPLIVVPKNVYYQWIKETSGKQERSLEKYVGALHHFPAVRELYNLNESVVYNTKQYTDPELAEIKRAIKNRQLVKDQNAEIFKNRTVPDTLFSSENPLEKFASQARNYAMSSIDDKIKALHTHYDSQIQAESIKNPDKAEKLMKQLSEEIAKIRASYPKTFADIYNRLVKEEYTYLVYVTGKFPEVPDGTVTIITEDALKMNKLGTKDSDKISERMYQILSQGDSISDDEDYDEREGTNLIEKIKERVESRLGNAKVTVEDLGCDMLILDEAHHYRKIFTKLQGKVKTDDNGQAVTTVSEGKGGRKRKTEREDTNYTLDSGSPSGVALSAFFLSTYIQMTNPTGNVILLTATPFENNPLEIYSILALANYAELEKAGFASMQDFFDTHMKVDYGYKIKIDGVEKDTILNGYVNLVQLRTIIRNVVLHRTGEQADIQRPEKVIIPYHNSGLLPDNISEIKTSLVPTDDQMELMQNIDMFIEGQLSMTDLQSRDMEKFLIEETLKEQEEIERAQREEEGGAAIEGEEGYTPSPAPKEKKIKNIIDVTLQIESEELGTRIIQAISLKRQVTLSPYLLKTRREANIDPTAEELIESSPKLKYVMACVKSVKDHHEKNGTPVSGQIIYSVIGKNFFPKFKEYLTDPKFGIGFKPEEVAIVSGGMSDNNKEDAKKGFNDGTIKVLIASKSIQVGANLHKKGTVLYHLFYDWNPTDNEQINGRIWRQGAEYSAVRIVYPMVENSIDPFIFQYLENKTNRIKDIWDMAGIKSQMDLSDFDPRKMKTEAMTDPAKRAKLEIEIIKDETLSEIMLTENKLREIRDIPTSIRSFKESMATASSYITSFHWGIAAFKISELTKEKNEKISEIKDELENIQEPVKAIERDRDVKIEEKQSQISEQQERINDIAEELIAEQKAIKVKMGDAATDEDDKLLKQLQADYKNLPATAEAEKTRLNKEIDRMNKEITRINADATKKIKALGDLSKKIKALENKIVSITESYAKKEETLKEQAKAKDDLAKSSDNHDGLKEYYTFLMRESTFLLNYLKDPMAEGKRSSDMEQFYYRSQDIILELEKFKNRKAEYERIKIKYLDPMGITDENAEQVVMTYQNKVEELRSKITEIDALQEELIAKFTKEYYERLANAKTPEQSAQDFALLNWLLDEKVEQVSAVATEAEVVIETLDKDYITDQIEMFKMALDDEKDQEQRDYLTDQIEMFEMAIQNVPEATKTPVKVTVKTGMVPTFREGGIISTGYHIIDAFTGTDTTMTEEAVIEFAQTRRDKDYESLDEDDELYVDPDITTVPIRDIDQALDYLDEEGVTYERIPVAYKQGGNISGGALSSYKDLVDEGLMTEGEFVTFMREKGYKVMKKSVYNEIKNVDDYDFMIKILGYNNLI